MTRLRLALPGHRHRPRLLIAGAALLALAAGALLAFVPPLLVFAGLAALAGAAWIARSADSMFLGVLAATILLPFGTLPFKIGLTPSFVELAALGLYAMLVIRGLMTADQPPRWSLLGPLVITLLGFSFFSFVIGSEGRPDSLTAHNYFKFMLGVLLFFGVLNIVRGVEDVRRVVRLLIIGGSLAAALGLALRAAPDGPALRVLTALEPIGYPNSGRVLRYVEDDVNGLERAIGFAVDPNAFGGLLALLGALAIGQALSTRPVLDRRLLWGASGLMALTVFLTYSRAALGGLVLAGLFLATVRYRRLWWIIGAAGLAGAFLIVGLGKGEAFSERVIDGLLFRDQANQMRLAEFNNAIAIIEAYPVFGVGFGSAPTIDLTTGVSSIYLTIGSRMGLVGLAIFLLTCATFFGLTWAAVRRSGAEAGDMLIGLQAAIVAALAVGLLDHYFFNIEFPHMVALFWLMIGLGMALVEFAPPKAAGPGAD